MKTRPCPHEFARLLGAALLGLLPMSAHAGLNGQQISFRTSGAELDWVRITGDNQYDIPVTWDSTRFGLVCNAGRCGEARTPNWWFKGKVAIEYRLRGEPATYSCHFYVNEQQPDLEWVNLLAPKQLVPLNRTPDGVTGSETRCEPRPLGGSNAAVLPIPLAVVESPERYVGYQGTGPLPHRFASRSEAAAAGCLFGHVKGPQVDTCVLGQYAGSSLNLTVYAPTRDGAMAAGNELAIPSQYYETTLELVDMQGQGTDWMVIETTGMHGTAIGQRVLLVIAWQVDRFRVVAAESLDYHCYRPPAPADYALQVRHDSDRWAASRACCSTTR